MKNIVLFILFFFLLACSNLKILPNYHISSNEIKNTLNKNLDKDIEYSRFKFHLEILEVNIVNKKLNFKIEIIPSNYITNLITSDKTTISLETDIKYFKKKIYTKDLKLLSINSNLNENVLKFIINKILIHFDSILIYDLEKKHNFKSKFINDIYIGDNNIVIVLI